MAYYWNGNPILAPLTIASNRNLWTVEKADLTMDRMYGTAQRWELYFSIMNNGDEDLIFEHLTKGMADSAYMVMPQLNSSQNWLRRNNRVLPSNVFTNEERLAGAINAAMTFPFQNNTRTGIPQSYFLQFDNHDKVYATVASKANGDGSSSADINVKLFPTLRQDVPSGTAVHLRDDVQLKYLLDDTTLQGITYQDGILHAISQLGVWEDLS